MTLEVGDGNKEVEVSIVAAANTHKDKVVRTTKVIPRGFPFKLFASGLLRYDGEGV